MATKEIPKFLEAKVNLRAKKITVELCELVPDSRVHGGRQLLVISS